MPVFLMILFVIGVFGVVSLSNSMKNPPKLTISGSKEVTTTADKVMISGTTDPKADLDINEKKVAVDKNGGFTYTTGTLKEGTQTFEVVASRLFASRTEKIKVTKNTLAPKVSTSPVVTSTPSAATSKKSTVTTESGTPTSGPAESVFGAFGLTLLAFSVYAYKKSLKIANQTTYKSFTSS